MRPYARHFIHRIFEGTKSFTTRWLKPMFTVAWASIRSTNSCEVHIFIEVLVTGNQTAYRVCLSALGSIGESQCLPARVQGHVHCVSQAPSTHLQGCITSSLTTPLNHKGGRPFVFKGRHGESFHCPYVYRATSRGNWVCKCSSTFFQSSSEI